MKACQYIDWLEKQREDLSNLWNIEPVYKPLFRKNYCGILESFPCFIHPEDANKTSLVSLRHTHREL